MTFANFILFGGGEVCAVTCVTESSTCKTYTSSMLEVYQNRQRLLWGFTDNRAGGGERKFVAFPEPLVAFEENSHFALGGGKGRESCAGHQFCGRITVIMLAVDRV